MITLITMAAALGGAPICASLPITGAGQVTSANGVMAIVGGEGRQGLRTSRGRVSPLGREVVTATIRASCQSGARDHVLVATTTRSTECPVRYRIAEIAGGRFVRATPGFGSCAEGANAQLTPTGFVVTMPAGPASPNNVMYRYLAGRIVATPPPPPVVAVAPAAVSGRPSSPRFAALSSGACATVGRNGAPRSSAVMLAEFTRTWPADWQSARRLRRQPLTAETLRQTVTELACLAALPGGDRLVLDAARPLFDSKRHGTVAFDQLDEVARGAATDPGVRAAARQFHAQMRFEVDTPRLH